MSERKLNMDNNKSDQERKKLNKKLLKDTFVSVFKSREKITFLEIVIDFIAAFIACFLSDCIVQRLSIGFWLIDIVITAGFLVIMLFIGTMLFKKIKKKS